MTPLFYTSETAAELLQCNPKTIQRLCHSGELKAYKRLRKWYIMPDDLVAYVKSGD